MSRYLRADLRRFFTKISRLIVLLVMLAVPFPIAAAVRGLKGLTDGYLFALTVYREMLPWLLGFAIFLGVFSDDLKAGTARAAIGSGVSRTGVVLTKWVEGLLLMSVLFAVQFGIFLLAGLLFGFPLNGEETRELLRETGLAALYSFGYFSLSLPVAFASLSTVASDLTYGALSLGVVRSVLGIFLSIDPVRKTVGDLEPYLFGSLVSRIGTCFTLGEAVPFRCVIGPAVYILGAAAAAALIFRKKELNF